MGLAVLGRPCLLIPNFMTRPKIKKIQPPIGKVQEISTYGLVSILHLWLPAQHGLGFRTESIASPEMHI